MILYNYLFLIDGYLRTVTDDTHVLVIESCDMLTSLKNVTQSGRLYFDGYLTRYMEKKICSCVHD